VHQPANIDRKLLRLRSRQQRAIGQGVQEPRLADPVFFVHQDAVHGGDLAGRAAEGQRGDA
jgi:hypothetical protein